MNNTRLQVRPDFSLSRLLLLLACCATVLLAVRTASAAPQTNQPLLRFTVLHSTRVAGPSEAMTGAEANCAISGTGEEATLKCRPIGVTKSHYYDYNLALVTDGSGTGYIIGCRVALVTNFWCKSMAAGRVFHGRFDDGKLAMTDGDKVQKYLVIAMGHVGALSTYQVQAPPPPPSGPPAPGAPPPAPQTPSAVATPAPAYSGPAPVVPSIDAPMPCGSDAGACVAFASTPQGADIYVDGKFVGNTPSTLSLPAGSHEIRIQSGKRKPWTRTFEAVAGSKITIRATL